MTAESQDLMKLFAIMKERMRSVGVQIDGPIKWQLMFTHAQPLGFHFTCDNPRVLQRMADKSDKLALDLNYPTPLGFEEWGQTSVGYTQIGQGSKLHFDIAIENEKKCRVYVVSNSNVVGRDWKGDAKRELNDNPIVTMVKNAAAYKGINLDQFGCYATKIYDNGSEPPGFDFKCTGQGMWSLYAHVQEMDSFKYDDPADKVSGGYFNQIATDGSGFREKGYGPRLHIELTPHDNAGNVHIDSHGFVREDGSYDWDEARKYHGPLDLSSGYIGFKVGGIPILPTISVTHMRDHDHDLSIAGSPDDEYYKPTQDPTNVNPGDIGRGWRFVVGLRAKF